MRRPSDCICTPGRDCLECRYKDCIRSGNGNVYPEETEMLACAQLPITPRTRKKRQPKQTDALNTGEEKGI